MAYQRRPTFAALGRKFAEVVFNSLMVLLAILTTISAAMAIAAFAYGAWYYAAYAGGLCAFGVVALRLALLHTVRPRD